MAQTPKENTLFNPKTFSEILTAKVKKDVANGVFTKQQGEHLIKEIEKAIKSVEKNARTK